MNIRFKITFACWVCAGAVPTLAARGPIMVGLDHNKDGSLYISSDLGSTWKQGWGRDIKVNYGVTITAEGMIYYRDQNDHVHSCLAKEGSNCDEPTQGVRARVLAAGSDGSLYHIDNAGGDRQRLFVSKDGGESWDAKCGTLDGGKRLNPTWDYRAIAPYLAPNSSGVTILRRDEPYIVDIPALDAAPENNCEVTIIPVGGAGVHRTAIVNAPDGKLWALNWNYWLDYTENKGKTWINVPTPAKAISDFAIAPDGTLFLLSKKKQDKTSDDAREAHYDDERTLWKSNNNGRAWDKVSENVPVDRIAIQPEVPADGSGTGLSSEALLDRKFNEVTFLMTHNSTSLRNESTALGDSLRKIAKKIPELFGRDKVLNLIKQATIQDPNIVADQERGIDDQLRDGVRAFKLPIYFADESKSKESDNILICHALNGGQIQDIIDVFDKPLKFLPKDWRKELLKPLYDLQKDPCVMDQTRVPLIDVLTKINQWLDKNPNELITIYFDAGLRDKDAALPVLLKLFKKSGLEEKRYRYTSGTEWPTLRELIKTGKRFIVFGETRNWDKGLSGDNMNIGIRIPNKRDIGFGSDYEYKTVSALKRDTQKPKIDWGEKDKTKIFIVDNYTSPLVSGRVTDAQQVNAYSEIKRRINNYEKAAGRPVTFVMVDFYDTPNNEAIRAITDVNHSRK